ncbi:hypothetical protein VNO78_05233 [Psophocarpus tetragonolobus]|uniref:Uncharacterized protein n=1 Tax=Psophocarpus tetragonolobus TaxID=3891 RepID=A0AAN9SQM1_PSOTE
MSLNIQFESNVMIHCASTEKSLALGTKIGRGKRERKSQQPLSLTCLTNSHLETIRVSLLSLSSVPSPLESKAYKTTSQLPLEPASLLLQSNHK